MIFSGEGERKVVPFRKVVSLLGLSTLFCWVIDGAHGDLHDPQVLEVCPVGALKAALAFSAPANL